MRMDLIYQFIPGCVKTYVIVLGGGDKEGQKCLDCETLYELLELG